MATHSSTPAWRIPWTEEPGRLQSTGSQRVGTRLSDLTYTSLMITYSHRMFVDALYQIDKEILFLT